MANYIRLTDNAYPVSQSQIRAENPQTSYPATFPTPEGYAVVFPAPAPTPTNPVIQIAREIAPALTAKGHYEQAYEIVDIYSDYTDEDDVLHTKAEQEAAAIAADAAQKIATLQASITTQTQARLDTFAQTRSYDGIKSASDYAGDEDPVFNAEGTYCKQMRSRTWRILINIMAEVQAGTRPMPSGFADIEGDLPELVWP